MNEHDKKYESLSEMLVAAKALAKYQSIHNVLRKDYIELLNIVENNKSHELVFDSLYRACLRSLFSLIEADIYGLNILDQYYDYRDNNAFLNKFKDTFKQIAKTWNKEEIQKQYFDSKLSKLKDLRKMRDELIHPKELIHIHKASELEFETLKTVFQDYDNFINELMDNFFLSTTMPSPIIP